MILLTINFKDAEGNILETRKVRNCTCVPNVGESVDYHNSLIRYYTKSKDIYYNEEGVHVIVVCQPNSL